MQLLLLLLCVGMSMAAVAKDKIIDLPGLTFKPNFTSYSGYLKGTGTKRLHYWFVTSQGDPAKDPLVLWLNGGPGCSSIEGLLNEHGPYMINSDGASLRRNPYSWNRIANMLYLEAPAGVGYSYSSDKQYATNDDQVATDNYWAVKNFLHNYPEFAKNEFYISGESYGGIYVPTLSQKVLSDNDINFKGFLVGNGALNFEMLDNSIIDFGYSHGLWGTSLMSKLIASCCKNSDPSDCNYYDNTAMQCQQAVSEAHGIIGTLNVYNMYAECFPSNMKVAAAASPYLSFMFSKNVLVQKIRLNLLQSMVMNNVSLSPPCVDASSITKYMNTATVRKAIHIPDDLPEWSICSAEVSAGYKRQYNNMSTQVLDVLKKHKALIYNGDIDMACNFLGDEWFTDSLNQPLVAARREWMYTAADGTQQVAGFVKHFQNLVYATIRGAGHMVPQDKPIVAFDMFSRFIQDQQL